jgi:hypothetical protein
MQHKLISFYNRDGKRFLFRKYVNFIQLVEAVFVNIHVPVFLGGKTDNHTIMRD